MESSSGADVVAEDAEDETAARGMELGSVEAGSHGLRVLLLYN